MAKVTRMTSVAAVVDTSITRQIKQADLSPVGIIVPSMLTEAQFQALNGTSWVLAYGQSVAGSAYASVTGNTTVPDLRGRAVFGKDDMGGTAINRITNAGSGIVGTTLGATGGKEDIAQHNHTAGSLVTSAHTKTDPGHQHVPVSAAGGSAYPAGAANYTFPSASLAQTDFGMRTSTGYTNMNISGDGTNSMNGHTVSGSSASTGAGIGSGTAHGNMPPTVIVNYFIKINY